MKNNMANKKILLSLTTITPGEWKNKVKEIDELGLKEIALFPTSLDIGQRQELYSLLEKTNLQSIPHVHLRSDMEINELDYLSKKFGTEIYNVHSELSSHPPLFDYADFIKKIYVENTEEIPTANDMKKYAGLCLDFSHWESIRLVNGEVGSENIEIKKLVKKYKIGINHISAVKSEKVHYHDRLTREDYFGYDFHWLDDLRELDYVKKYKNYLADIISIELENPLKRQLEVKKYLEEIIL